MAASCLSSSSKPDQIHVRDRIDAFRTAVVDPVDG